MSTKSVLLHGDTFRKYSTVYNNINLLTYNNTNNSLLIPLLLVIILSIIIAFITIFDILLGFNIFFMIESIIG